ncbi:lysoplasmalogenase [Hamadaea tsunoensis]|uniref:lysoplasmalogenase n=1 Tax=Hamadaea tsunoensis TaxID=53368 RepID=UPI0003F6AD56|nr:lysoplasmalogenase [Hamadaea tsunoensis]
MILVAYAMVGLAHLVSLETGPHWLEQLTKWVLVPTLALWVATRRGPKPIVAALLFGAAGDITLGFDGWFIVGMGCFAVGHACYVTYFVRNGAFAGLRRRPWIPAAYLVVWLLLIVWLWPGLDAGLRVPVAAYSLLLIATGATSAGYGLRTGLGGLLFVVSDAILAMGLADRPQLWPSDIWVMTTYILAQFLLATGVVYALRPAVREAVA